MRKWLSRKATVSAVVAIVLVTALAGTAWALSNINLKLGTVASYDFGEFGGVGPGTVEINAFTMRPGDVVPWHYHKGLSYVIVVRGRIAERELNPDGSCGSIGRDATGTAFVEPPGRQHTVSNPGPGAAIVYWATIFPQGDPSGDAVYLDPQPACN